MEGIVLLALGLATNKIVLRLKRQSGNYFSRKLLQKPSKTVPTLLVSRHPH